MEAVRDGHPEVATAFVFPGQGSQFVGMGHDLYEKSPAARRVFETVDSVLEFPLSRLIFEGPQPELEKTVHSQPAIYAVSIAALEAAREQLGEEFASRSVVMAGHSLGEYTALAVAGALSVEDGARLVRERGLLMQKAAEYAPGGMAAIIGLDEITLEEVCQETGAKIANLNTEDQIVISGDRLSLARAMDLAAIRGARKTIPLAVSGAFHSSLMWPAKEGLAQALQNVRFHRTRVPVVANVTAHPISTPRAVREELVTQLCNCVQWKRSVDYMVNSSGARNFIEFGPRKTLSSLVKRINDEVEAASITDFASIQALCN